MSLFLLMWFDLGELCERCSWNISLIISQANRAMKQTWIFPQEQLLPVLRLMIQGRLKNFLYESWLKLVVSNFWFHSCRHCKVHRLLFKPFSYSYCSLRTLSLVNVIYTKIKILYKKLFLKGFTRLRFYVQFFPFFYEMKVWKFLYKKKR